MCISHWSSDVCSSDLKRMRERVQADGHWTIDLDTPAQLNEAMDAIGHYFACLVSIGLGGKEIDRFVCPIEIVTGFVAPFHLVTGLLVEFKDAWERILQSFNRNSQVAQRYGHVAQTGRAVRQTQLFSYFCCLSWGP